MEAFRVLNIEIPFITAATMVQLKLGLTDPPLNNNK